MGEIYEVYPCIAQERFEVIYEVFLLYYDNFSIEYS